MKIIKRSFFLFIAVVIGLVVASIFTVYFLGKSDEIIKDEVNKYLYSNNITKCKIEKLFIPENYKYSKHGEKLKVSADELSEILKIELNNYAQIKPLEREVIKEDDYLSVNYEVYNGDELLGKAADIYFQVGSNEFSSEIEKQLIGLIKGEKITFWSKTNNDEVNKYKIVVTSINDYYLPEVTNQFVIENYNEEGLKTTNDFYSWIKNKAYENKRSEYIFDIRNEIRDAIIKRSKFTIDDGEVAEYAVDIYKKYEQIAFLCGYENIEDYCKNELNLTKDEFLSMCCEEGKNDIKEALIIGAIAFKENICVSDEEIQKYCEENEEQIENKDQICYTIIENKVYDLLLSDIIKSV